jgi:hypothetical protein
VTAKAIGGANTRIVGGHAREVGEDGLAREVASDVGALLSVIAAQHQIRLLGFHRRTKAHENGKSKLRIVSK